MQGHTTNAQSWVDGFDAFQSTRINPVDRRTHKYNVADFRISGFPDFRIERDLFTEQVFEKSYIGEIQTLVEQRLIVCFTVRAVADNGAKSHPGNGLHLIDMDLRRDTEFVIQSF